MKWLISFLFSLAFTASAAWADYPDKPVRLIVPLPAGGPTDAVARSLADTLSRALGTPFVVENRPGADGAIGARTVIGAPADGYTLLFGIGSLVALPYMQNPAPYDTEKELNPVAMVGRFPFALAVNPSVPATTIREFVAVAKTRPGELFYASSTASEALAAVEFMNAAGIRMIRVPYKGAAQAMPDLLSGRVHAMFSPISAVLPASKDGKLRLLATFSSARVPAAPDVPTLSEAGITGVEVPTWQAVFAPPGVPDSIVDRLNSAISAALRTEELRRKLDGLMLQVEPSTPAELRDRIHREGQAWKQFVREHNLDPQ
jgi:tripartite-type tricarboxylate transporter receptor subunit TctC